MAKISLPQNAYVYAILVDGIVRYIGKGRGRRAKHHVAIARQLNARRAKGEKIKATYFYNRLAKAIRTKARVEVRIVSCHTSDAEAFEREIQEIAAAPVGQLWNVLNGGQGVSPEQGRLFWEQTDLVTRAKILAAPHSPAARARRKLTWRAMWERMTPEERAAWTAATRTPEALAKKTQALIGQWERRSPESREAVLNAINSESSRIKVGKATKRRWDNDDNYRTKIVGVLAAIRPKNKASETMKARWANDYEAQLARTMAGMAKPEAKRRRAIATSRAWANPISREKRLSGMRNAWTDEKRKEHSIKCKRSWEQRHRKEK